MTSLFSRLQKLNKEASRVWSANGALLSIEGQDSVYVYLIGYPNAELAAECRNSLPAVLNLIEAAQRLTDWVYEHGLDQAEQADRLHRSPSVLDEALAAVAVFVPGQEEPQ